MQEIEDEGLQRAISTLVFSVHVVHPLLCTNRSKHSTITERTGNTDAGTRPNALV
ncbi:hypothetical protein [Parasutterella muris]|uniref:hypothetical protein n=1 Tax=Parasutterella muris TaxID=2565572 RepID=UPI001F34B860|nr:hypothetical protein [Parasutterella muris]